MTKPSVWDVLKISRRLGELKDSLGTSLNRRDRAEALIGACILENIDTKFEIVKMLGFCGLSKDFVDRIIDERTGPIPGDHLWRIDEFGRYHLID